ncbi:MAG TPA: hypothetical protein VL986_02800 [Terracidiphilus sp.]|nr:hypothetical protein [Terracidiphilus sp.]
MKRCDHNHELESDGEPQPAGPTTGPTIRRIEMTVEREIVTVVRRPAGSKDESTTGVSVGGAVCELCGQSLPTGIPALPAEAGGETDSKTNDEAE